MKPDKAVRTVRIIGNPYHRMRQKQRAMSQSVESDLIACNPFPALTPLGLHPQLEGGRLSGIVKTEYVRNTTISNGYEEIWRRGRDSNPRSGV
ncbi:MAG: hypothetical protein LBV45_01875 [Xanthomonadaceae bacterium]|nr:hypothetical protein [Xanthomonadaceae bacterium]